MGNHQGVSRLGGLKPHRRGRQLKHGRAKKGHNVGNQYFKTLIKAIAAK